MSADIVAIAVAVPARDEAHRIGACLLALGRAAERVEQPVHVVVAADRCRDGTAEIARCVLAETTSLTGAVVELAVSSAGRARESAAATAVGFTRRYGPLDRIWLASTDADSHVDADWLQSHLRWAHRGYAAVSGLVRLDVDASSETQLQYSRYISDRGAHVGHGHVHGANLGLRADWWHEVGGFPLVATGEDNGLWHRLRRSGAEVLGVDDLGVTTSSRLTGRAPGGLADLLAGLPSNDPACVALP